MAERKGTVFNAGLTKIAQEHKIGREVRGMGVMLAIELRIDIQHILLESLREHVIFTYSGRNVVRLLPPIVIEDASINRSLEVLDKVVSSEEAKLNG
jgi:acetylornithine/LysW-gamma-L-lysine aminotransferase